MGTSCLDKTIVGEVEIRLLCAMDELLFKMLFRREEGGRDLDRRVAFFLVFCSHFRHGSINNSMTFALHVMAC